MEERLAEAHTIDEIVAALVLGLEEFIEDERANRSVLYELLSASRHSEEIRARDGRALPDLARQPRRRACGARRPRA